MLPTGEVPHGCIAGVAVAGDVVIRYLLRRGDSGPVVLVHDWPQTVYAWRHLLAVLAPGHTVLAVDLRGAGGSSAPAGGYDKEQLAGDLHGVLTALGLRRPLLVGHGIGGMVAFAYARDHPGDTAGVVLVDTCLPGVAGWDESGSGRNAWHLGFHTHRGGSGGIAEKLVARNQLVYFRSFIDRFAVHPERISDTDIAVYAAAASEGAHLHAGFELFRSLPLDEQRFASLPLPADVPVLLAYAQYSLATLLDTVADGLRGRGLSDVRTAAVADSGHWIPEEQPAALIELVENFVRDVQP